MKIVICMPTGMDGIHDESIISDVLQTVVNRIVYEGEISGEFEADDQRNMVTFEVSE